MKHFVVKIKGCVRTQLIYIWNEELHKYFKSIVTNDLFGIEFEFVVGP